MRLALITAFLISGCASLGSSTLFTQKQFQYLKFLEGRWVGTGPDGQPFYEQYALVGPAELTSTRFKDGSYSEKTDSSTVRLDEGVITSTWKEFTWRAVSIAPNKACFDPINAPSSFCWEQVSDNSVEVTQRWTNEKGEPQQYVVAMRRSGDGVKEAN